MTERYEYRVIFRLQPKPGHHVLTTVEARDIHHARNIKQGLAVVGLSAQIYEHKRVTSAEIVE